MSKKRAVVTLAIGKWEYLPPIHRPMARYADYCKADFIKITDRRFPNWHIYYEKFQIANMLADEYDEVLYLDGDCLVTPLAFDAPSWFDVVPPEYNLGMMNERALNDFQTRTWVDDQYAMIGEEVKENWDGTYYNAGVYLVRRGAIDLYESDKVTSEDYQDQITMNYEIQSNRLKYHVFPVNWRYDTMPIACLHVDPKQAYILHYGGWWNFDMSVEDLIGVMSAWPYFPNWFLQRRKKSIDYPYGAEIKNPPDASHGSAVGTRGVGVGDEYVLPPSSVMKFPSSEMPAQQRSGPHPRSGGR